MADYRFHLVNLRDWYPAIESLCKKHYAEMQERLAADGVPIGDFNPRTETYFQAADRGEFLMFIALEDNDLIGYSGIWVTPDMHNGQLIASEDTIYVLPGHRNGAGKALAKFILNHLENIGVKRVTITPVTDLRVGKIWQRLGFKPVAQLMTYTFNEKAA
jgi:GNAT superfamily N-acetyltransferase